MARWSLVRLILLAVALVAVGQPAQAAAPGPTIVVGVPGLLWSDVNAQVTPALWQLTGDGSAASLVTRTTMAYTCPEAAWLTISAGQRADGNCKRPAPVATGATISDWAALAKLNHGTSYQAKVGLLGDQVHAAGGCTTAIGAGAVYGAVDTAGRVDHYAAAVTAQALGQCALTTVQTSADPAAADRQIAQVLAQAPGNANVYVLGISDRVTRTHLHVAVARGEAGYLAAPSTRRTGLVTLTDVTATILHTLGRGQPLDAVGSVWHSVGSAAGPGAKVAHLTGQDVAAQTDAHLATPFFYGLFAFELLLYLVAAVALGALPVLVRVLALACAAAPVSAVLVNLLPWWRAGNPDAAMVAGFAVITVLVTALALLAGRRWPRRPNMAALAVACLTALVFGGDVATGSHLQLNSPMGYSSLVAGRFYGFGNAAFAVFAAGALLAAGWLAQWPLDAGRRRAACVLAAVIGLWAVAMDGAPWFGADFGGVLAIIVATAVLVTMLAGRRVSVLRLALFGLAGLVAVLAIAFVDSLRPASSQTHLGRFFEQLESGEAFGVIGRKFGSMVHSLHYWQYTAITVVAVVFLVVVLLRRGLLAGPYARFGTLRPTLLAVSTMLVLGGLMNDSGIVIPALALTVLVPLYLDVALSARRPGPRAATGTPLPSPPAARPAPRG